MASIFLSFPPLANARVRLSGDQISTSTLRAFVVPSKGRASSESRANPNHSLLVRAGGEEGELAAVG